MANFLYICSSVLLCLGLALVDGGADFLYICSTVLLCLGLTLAEGGAGGNPMTNIQGMMKQMMSKINVVTMCPPTCDSWCKMMDMTCMDVPDLKDCTKSDADCKDTCTGLCGCYSKCNTDCDSAESCQGLTGVEAEGCMARNLNCKNECMPLCAPDFMSKKNGEDMKDFEVMLSGMLQKVYQEMLDLETRP